MATNEDMSTEELIRLLEGTEENNEFSETESLDEEDLEPPHQQNTIIENNSIPSTSRQQHARLRKQVDSSFQWTSEQYTPNIANFDNFLSGLHFEPLENKTEFDIFQHFLDNDLMLFIVNMTNKFHSDFVLNVDLRMHSRLNAWHDITIPELYIFFAIVLLMTRNRHLSIEEHWSTDILLLSPIFSNLMSRNRFCMILGMLHFSERSEETSFMSKIDKCISHARNKFKYILTPFKTLCIDESIVPFKGRLSIKQYLPNKRNRFGIKLFVLCDVETGIIIDFIVYCGGNTDITDPCNLGVGGAVVATLLRDFLGSNRHLYVDSWYTSPALFKYLYQNNIYACGTVKKNRTGMPNFNHALQPGEVEIKNSPPLMALKWKDKKIVYILSTIHKNILEPSMKEDRRTGLPIMKPKAVLDYSKNIGSVDTADMLLSSLQCIRKSIKWYKKPFLNIVMENLITGA